MAVQTRNYLEKEKMSDISEIIKTIKEMVIAKITDNTVLIMFYL